MWFTFLLLLQQCDKGLCCRYTGSMPFDFAIMPTIILLPPQLSLIYASIKLKPRLLPSHWLASLPMELAPLLKIWQLMSAFMNMMYALANLSQLGQVGGLRSLPLVRLLNTSEAQSRIQTL